MQIYHSSPIVYPRPYPTIIQHDRSNKVITLLAITILIGCIAYWIYTNFWHQGKVVQQLPPLNPPPLLKEEEILDEEKKRVVAPQKSQVAPIKRKQKEKRVKAAPVIYISKPPARREIEKETPKLIVAEKEIIDDLSLTIEENIENQLTPYLAQEKQKYSHKGMFIRYEGIYASLKDLEKNSKNEYVQFCNAAFIEENQETPSATELFLSIDPNQRLLVLKILLEEIENSTIPIKGSIFSSEKSAAKKAIILQFPTISKGSASSELELFLTLLRDHLLDKSVQPDGRAPMDGVMPFISGDKVQPYFYY